MPVWWKADRRDGGSFGSNYKLMSMVNQTFKYMSRISFHIKHETVRLWLVTMTMTTSTEG